MHSTVVRTETFLRTDIQNILRALDSANRGLTDHLPNAEVAIYRKGYIDALQSVANAIGLDLHLSEIQPKTNGYRRNDANGSGTFTMDMGVQFSSDHLQDS